ncbi:hypothetical protein Acr_18g0006390 [Actinidia rufa]|uniref:Uncharacterized protein n=1 Tax=Actinidia rufa TaxID=165716 RepID=A0A7J0G6S2_9ERIC|nr:hypothetical protein Acr_18g0006390 [Actinidia rufa]
MEQGSPTKKSKSKGKAGVDYDASHFTGQNEEKLFNKVWVRNGAVLKRKLNLVALENTGIRYPERKTQSLHFLMLGCQDLVVVSQKLLLEGDEWDGEMQCYKTCLKDKGSMPFTGFLTELFKRSRVHIPLDFTRFEPKGPIDRASLSRSEGQRKKRKLEEGST